MIAVQRLRLATIGILILALATPTGVFARDGRGGDRRWQHPAQQAPQQQAVPQQAPAAQNKASQRRWGEWNDRRDRGRDGAGRGGGDRWNRDRDQQAPAQPAPAAPAPPAQPTPQSAPVPRDRGRFNRGDNASGRWNSPGWRDRNGSNGGSGTSGDDGPGGNNGSGDNFNGGTSTPIATTPPAGSAPATPAPVATPAPGTGASPTTPGDDGSRKPQDGGRKQKKTPNRPANAPVAAAGGIVASAPAVPAGGAADGKKSSASNGKKKPGGESTAGIVGSFVVTRIVGEIPSWVAWSLGGITAVALLCAGFFWRERRRRRLAEQDAMADALTGIANRKAFERRIDLEWKRAVRYGRSLGLMVVDVDGFKLVNDQHGHAAGDEVLREIASRLEDRLRDTDLVARIGGDEFAVICPETGITELETVRDQLRNHVADEGVRGVGVSIGVAEWKPGDESWSELIARADESMYALKRQTHAAQLSAAVTST